MGLDVVVYRNKRDFETQVQNGILAVDIDTGEVYYPVEASKSTGGPLEGFVAFEARLGNSAKIGYLRSRLLPLLSAESFVCSKVLGSGTHSGDALRFDVVVRLREELDMVANDVTLTDEKEIAQFCATMKHCLDAAIREDNPIVFV